MARKLRKLAGGLAVAFAVLAVAEIAARLIVGPAPVTSLDVDYEPDEAVGFRPQAGYRREGLALNSLGARGAEVDPAREERILVIGDSVTLGAEVADGETFCAGLERALGPRAQVVNGGCPGYGPHEYAAAIRRL